MRGLKAKTMRRVAREAGLPPLTYTQKIHQRQRMQPVLTAGKTTFQPVTVQRRQILLGRCQKQMVKIMKAPRPMYAHLACPKNSFFGVSLDYFRSGGVPEGLRNATLTILDGPPAAA